MRRRVARLCAGALGAAALLVVAIGLIAVRPRPAFAAPTDTLCTPTQVLVWTVAPRLHVRCAAAVGGITYFALSTADAAQAARVLTILTAAQVAGRTLVIRFDPADLSGAAIGCLNSDCRLIQAVGFGQ